MRRGGLALAVLLLLAPSGFAAAPGVYAISNGTVHPVTGPAIANGVVVIRDGLIEAVGANLAVPADATVIDARGGHVYPGFIDAYTSTGITAPKERPEYTPSTLAFELVALSETDLDAKRGTGVTTVVTAPTSGIFNGQSVVLNLGPGTAASRVIRNRAGMHVAFNTRQRGSIRGR
jgi:imidazolonepropionase-like amidohydrolase